MYAQRMNSRKDKRKNFDILDAVHRRLRRKTKGCLRPQDIAQELRPAQLVRESLTLPGELPGVVIPLCPAPTKRNLRLCDPRLLLENTERLPLYRNCEVVVIAYDFKCDFIEVGNGS